jgi:DNA sulfur modification protein DndB
MKATIVSGFPITGSVAVQNHEFVTTIPGAQLMKITQDPRNSEIPKARETVPGLEALYTIRKEVQRLFVGAKHRNVESYAAYIAAMGNGTARITPQIVLYTSTELHEENGVLTLPWDTELVAIDGETQLAARFEAANINPETRNLMADVRICYGYPISWAKQAFHDLNLLAVRLNAATGLGMDERDPITKLTRLISDLPFFRGRVSMHRQLKNTDKDNSICTLSALRLGVICFAEGIGGLKYGNKPVDIEPSRLDIIGRNAVDYFGKLTEHLGSALEARNDTVAAAPPVMAAFGALGHPAANVIGDTARFSEIDRALELLNDVNFRRGPAWVGIAGEMRPASVSKKGKVKAAIFSTAGGAKDSGHASFAALSDPNSPQYRAVRGLEVMAPAAA